MTTHLTMCFAMFAWIGVAGLGCARQAVTDVLATKTFGQRQLEQMLDDRPDMRDAIPVSHPVRRWVADAFDGKQFGQRV